MKVILQVPEWSETRSQKMARKWALRLPFGHSNGFIFVVLIFPSFFGSGPAQFPCGEPPQHLAVESCQTSCIKSESEFESESQFQLELPTLLAPGTHTHH